MIHLDTHVVVWLYQGDVKKLSQRAQQLIEDNDICISPMVMLEIEYLFEIKRIKSNIATKCATEYGKNILVAIVVYVG